MKKYIKPRVGEYFIRKSYLPFMKGADAGWTNWESVIASNEQDALAMVVHRGFFSNEEYFVSKGKLVWTIYYHDLALIEIECADYNVKENIFEKVLRLCKKALKLNKR